LTNTVEGRILSHLPLGHRRQSSAPERQQRPRGYASSAAPSQHANHLPSNLPRRQPSLLNGHLRQQRHDSVRQPGRHPGPMHRVKLRVWQAGADSVQREPFGLSYRIQPSGLAIVGSLLGELCLRERESSTTTLGQVGLVKRLDWKGASDTRLFERA
jgi:hypothetical protein